MPDRSVNRRRFLTAAALTAGAAALPGGQLSGRAAALPSQITLPDRGIHDTSPAATWTGGFLTGNGEYGAVLYGAPDLEKVVFNYHRLVLPNGTRDLTPPVISGRLDGVRDKALAGDYAGANRDFAAGWSLRWTQAYHPAYELRIATPGATTVDNYVRVTDFRSGEVSSSWTDQYGTWTRRAFVSRADKVIVQELIPAPGRTVDTTLGVHTALDGLPADLSFTTRATVTGTSGYLNLRGTYASGKGAFGYEGVTRVVVSGDDAELTAGGPTIVVAKAERVLLLTKLARYESPTGWDAEPLHAQLAALDAHYAPLRQRHTVRHADLYDRSRLDLNVTPTDRQLPVGDLIARQNADRSVIDTALLERLYDSGRYLFISSSGVLPPRLTGIWAGSWGAAWADDFTTDANVNLQVAGGNILDTTELMEGYTQLILGQLDHWRTNAKNLYGARGFLAPSRTDGEYGHMLHFNNGSFPGHTWTGGADWLLHPLLEYYEVTGDRAFLKDKLGPALMELALFYEDFLTRTDANGKTVFVPSFSMENSPGNTGVCLATNATGDIMAGKHALRAAIDAADALGVEQGEDEGVARWTALLKKIPAYRVNEQGALAEWSWPSLTDRYNHRHVQHLYGAWPLHEINPEDEPDLVRPAQRALELRGDQNISAHGSLHRALAGARLKDGGQVYGNLRKILGNNMVFTSLMTSHNPNLDIYNADAAHAIPGVLAEALCYSRPGVLELLPALPDQFAKGSLTGLRARGRIRVHRLSWDLAARTVTLSVTSAVTQDVTLISRRGMASVTTSATVTPSSLGTHARKVSLTAGRRTNIAVSLLSGYFRLVNRGSGKVLDVRSGSTADGAGIIQWAWSGSANQQWRLLPDADGSFRLAARHSGKILTGHDSSGPSAQLTQEQDGNRDDQHWKLVEVDSEHVRLVNVHNGGCAGVDGGSTAGGAPVVYQPADSGAHQQWRLVAL
ncbi:glycoside hydrolase N-terminal domain-containing protein [Streptomyces sp. VRA16 Mangrove soil]|uniref:glycosyl hydrolase family 95 catalytic domain-containing protein n=1 Tax=Streptomyces sp. VRA16 Mangrove soil TaxID=2817434 RepID=UPI001A9EEA19|nr:glycoside hydrolase N-terminal domain-containing protein [Streptomyces sp. VRA16 Mangrove soil]MBO1329819.1 glycoside hydrolase N-terminal domain-containing protein [Streptomyces sp. VRA16 Mangrove soil]